MNFSNAVITKDHFVTLAGYNVWANDIVHSWFDKLTDEQWNQPIVSSFPSISATSAHTAGAETIWLDRLNGIVEPRLAGVTVGGSKVEVQAAWKNSSAGLKAFVDNLDENRLQEPVRFRRIDGNTYELQHDEILAHVFNHSTYHRGQIVTMLRQAGFTELKSTDMVSYFWSKKN